MKLLRLYRFLMLMNIAITLCAFTLAAEASIFSPYTITEEDMVMGSKDAPVTMIEYSSLSCPHCAEFNAKIFPALKENYIDTGKVRFVHRDFPLDGRSLHGAVLARCAGEKKYFTFMKILFAEQASWLLQDNYLEILSNIGKLGGVSGAQFEQCLQEKKIENIILSMRLVGTKELDIRGVPAFFINGDPYRGAHSKEALFGFLDKIVTAALKP